MLSRAQPDADDGTINNPNGTDRYTAVEGARWERPLVVADVNMLRSRDRAQPGFALSYSAKLRGCTHNHR